MKKTTIGVESKYHDEAATAVKWTGGKAVILIVVEGYKGSGMAVSCVPGPHQDLGEPTKLAAHFRLLADIIDSGIGPDGVTRSQPSKERPS